MTNLNKNNQTGTPIYFDDFLTKASWEKSKSKKMLQFRPYPATNIIETDAYFQIEIAAPGVDISVLEMEIYETGVEVRFDAPNNADIKGMERIWTQEFDSSSFKRRYELNPEIVDFAAIEAECNKGIIRIFMPKQKEKIGHFLPVFTFSDN